MEKGIIEREFELNKQGLKVYVIINGNDVSLEFDKNFTFLSKLLRIEKSDGITTVYLAYKKLFRIKDGAINSIFPISDIEVKVLSAIYNNMKQSKDKDLVLYFKKIKNNISDSIYTMFKKNTSKSKKGEYHTNLISILNSKEFIKFLNEYAIDYPMNMYGQLDFVDGSDTPFEHVEKNDWCANLEDALGIDLGKEYNYESLEKAIKNREKLLKRASEALEEFLSSNAEWCKIEEDLNSNIERLEQKMVDLENSKKDKSKREQKTINDEKMRVSNELARLKNFKPAYAASIIYNELLNVSLTKLAIEKVEYSEISFSNESRLRFMCERHKNDKRFKFVYSIDRLKSVKSFKEAAKDLESLLNNKMVIGLDIVGLEQDFEEDDINEFKEKLEWILPVLHIHTESLLKIHASDFMDGTDNVYIALKALKETINKINETCVDLFGEEWGIIPPPRIVIGNAINVRDNKELVNLIKEFDAVVEINANSVNKGKIDPKDYDDNNIKYFLFNGTDGMMNQIVTEKPSTKKKTAKKVESKYATYLDAVDEENILFSSFGITSDVDKAKDELKKFKEYLEEHNVTVDKYYLQEKLNIIEGFTNKIHYSEVAKIYIFLLERELCPSFVSNLKSVQYLYETSKDDSLKENVENEFSKLFVLISGQYQADSESIRKYKE